LGANKKRGHRCSSLEGLTQKGARLLTQKMGRSLQGLKKKKRGVGGEDKIPGQKSNCREYRERGEKQQGKEMEDFYFGQFGYEVDKGRALILRKGGKTA